MKKIFIISNSCWNIINFRSNLIEELIEQGFKVGISAPKDKFVNKLNLNKYDYFPINYKRNTYNIYENIKIFLNFFLLFIKEKPDKVLLFTIKPNFFASLATLIIFRKIEVFNFITGLGSFYFEKNFKKKFLILLYKIVLLKSNKIIFQNNDDLEFFTYNKIVNHKKCILIPGSGVDTEKFHFVNLKNTNNIKLRFLCVSRIIKQKGINELLAAAKLIKKEFTAVSFTLVGSIDYENKSKLNKNLIETYKNYFNFIEYSDKISELIKDCDCFILPSYREGTSRSILEAASMGRPIITTDVAGCNNIVFDNFNGYLCLPRDTNSLYQTIKKMINTNFHDRVKMGKNSRKLIVENFDVNLINKQIFTKLNLISEK